MKENKTLESPTAPLANRRPEHVETNEEGAVEELEISAKACFRNAILYNPVNFDGGANAEV